MTDKREEVFRASVGLSLASEAREAGREVAKDALDRLGAKPDFFLLFSTIHYEKRGGFDEFLKGVWEVLPEGTPLIGGTVAGFMNQRGCYTRGATALAVSYPTMDVAIGLGRRVKTNPVKAAKKCVEDLNDSLVDSTYPRKFIYCMVSSSTLFDLPGVGKKKIVRNRVIGDLLVKSAGIMHYLQKGIGRESEVLDKIVDMMPEYSIIGGSSMDNMDFTGNYQFFNREVVSNSMVALAISIDVRLGVSFNHGMQKTGKILEISKVSRNRHVIESINNRDATPEFLSMLNWPEDFLDENRVYNTVPYYPLGFDKGGFIQPLVTPYFFGKNILTSYPVEDKKAHILKGSGSSIIESSRKALEESGINNPLLGLFSECATRVYSLGIFVYREQEIMKEFFGKAPFLVLYMGGECAYIPKDKKIYGNELLCSAIFS